MFTQRSVLALTMCAALLLPTPSVSWLSVAVAQNEGRRARPRQAQPEGVLPDLEDLKTESQIEREAPGPIPSTIPSRRNAGKPWDGRRVGDPSPRDVAQLKRTRRFAHAARRATPPPTVLDSYFVDNFFDVVLLRDATNAETTYWHDLLRVAPVQGSLKLAAVELGRTLFESAEYLARDRNAHWYVYDLYKTYLMREPDAGGWATWEALVSTHGREYVRRGFEESGEFATLMANMAADGTAPASAVSLTSARVDPRNQPGHGMLTRDASWSVPLLSLPGRNGLDLGLALSYSSMVWTRSGPYIYFDEDNGFPSPGFRLGFPTVQRKSFNAQTEKNAYLLITPAGRRVELRQTGANIYDAADSSYLQLKEDGASLLVHSTDGTRLKFTEFNGEYRCIEVKDRNGNYITVNYSSLGRITNITDTLGRVIVFNYDSNVNLLSITQSWHGQPSHQWVSFGWDTRTLQSGFSGAAVVGIKNGTVLPVLTQVALNDTSHFTFDYTNSLQLSAVKNYFGTLERNATTFTYETPAADAPRLLSRSVSARNWTGFNNVPAQVTQYSVDANGVCSLTAPDGTVYKEYYGTGWQRGLTVRSEVVVGGTPQKWTTTTWAQDEPSLSYEVNPRVVETNVYDNSQNRRRTVIDYGPYAQYGLPHVVTEFAANGTNALRQTFTDYNVSPAYLERRIIGLVSQVRVADGNGQDQSKVTYTYDDPARLQSVPATATQHDAAAITARGNVTAVSRWDVTDINNGAKKLTSYTNYYTTGTPGSTTDPAGHQSTVAYADAFSDGVPRNTFAYPTMLTDADGFSSYVQYNFDFGATTRTQSPAPAGQSQGAIQTLTYNSLGQLERITTTNNGAYKRFWYGAEFTASYATVNNVADELYSIQVTDGLGRVIGALSNHPGSAGGYRLVNTVYDQMGRAWLQSHPTEVNSAWVASGDDAAGIYYTQQTYDWQGRPLVTTNPDGTTKTASYAGCGCAGRTVVTLTDEGTIEAGSTKRRQQKIYSDVLGRTVKTEVLTWENGGVYAATINTYNSRDQVTQVRQYAGPEGSGTFQDMTFTYDGYGRVKTRHVPEQTANTNTTWHYNPDGTIQKVTDARNAVTNYTYNERQLVTGITYTVPSESQIPVPGAVSFSYDAAGNRSTMSDSTGSTSYSYDSLSLLTSESRSFNGLSGAYALNYSYNLANALTVLAIPFKSQQVGYNHDTAGRLSGVTASGFSATYGVWPNQQTQNLTSFASNITYRAWGARKSMTYGNTTSEQTTYNARLQPATYTLSNMNYQNTSVCCNYPTYSTMTWSYGYYDDGSLKHAWDSSNEWFDRAYKYDHAGRLKEASTFRRARGLSPYPAVSNADPYHQTISYDAFNHSSRSGSLYTGQPPADTGTYVDNRRTDSGWEYDADGNNTRDPSYQQTFNAAGALVHSVAHAKVGDGVDYPFEPRLDITQTYDGLGAPAKREQISRLPGLMDESGNPAAPIEDTQTTHYVRSSVLGGATIAELGPANVVHIYAGGQRIARDAWGQVTFEHHNPVTGSWVTSNGHSSSRSTGREERDPRGAELPLSNPYGDGVTYVDMKFAQPLFIEGGDPFDYSSGRTIDGLPVSEAEFQRRLGNGSAGVGAFVGGMVAGFTDLSRHPAITHVTIVFDIYRSGQATNTPDFWYYLGQSTEEFGIEPTFQRRRRKPNSSPLKTPIAVPFPGTEAIQKRIETGECNAYITTLLAKASELFGSGGNEPVAKDGLDLLRQISKQANGGFMLKDFLKVDGWPVSGTVSGSIKGNYRFAAGTATVLLSTRFMLHNDSRNVELWQSDYVTTAIHEMLHLAGRYQGYSDRELAVAASSLPGASAGLPPEPSDAQDMLGRLANSDYFDNELKRYCGGK